MIAAGKKFNKTVQLSIGHADLKNAAVMLFAAVASTDSMIQLFHKLALSALNLTTRSWEIIQFLMKDTGT